MDSDDDIQPLIQYEGGSRNLYLELDSQLLNTDPDFDQVVYGYRKSRCRIFVTYLLSTLLCGIPFLVFHWYPTWLLYATSVICSFQIADSVLVVETYQKKCKSFYIHKIVNKNIADASGLLNQGFIDESESEKAPIESVDAIHIPIHLDDGSTINVQNYRYFRHKKQSYIWDGGRAQWFKLGGIECGATCAQLHAVGGTPPSSERRVRMLNIYGINEINVPVQSIMTLILLEVFNPFYIFQLFTIAVWLAEPYYYYCIAVVLMSTFGVATSVIQTKKNQSNLRATVEAHDTVELWDGRRVDSRMVAPGDVILLPNRTTLHFDAALLSGSAVLNESMLTGESVPVTKTALLRVDRPFSLKEHASSILFCGTRVIQTRYYNNEPVRALVLRTGYNTSKGQLVRSILYPVPADFKFDRDSYKFIIILAVIAVLGLAYTVALKAYRALSPRDIAIKALDIITIVIPPALPAAMTVGRLYAVSRLKRARIACLNTRAVNVSGSIDCMCFDKTGTLTEDGLDMWGVVPVSAATRPPRLGRPQRDPRLLNELHPLKMAMATCHSLTLLDSELAGDPLDLKMFESTGWVLEEPDVPESSNYEILTPTIVKPKKTANIDVDDIHLPLEVGIVQQHQFVSSLQRASVVTRVLGEDVLRVYCKGAPEMLSTLCVKDTVPDNLFEVLNSYAEKGYRVIACATRVLEVTHKQLQKMHREEVERELEFLGLVIMENRLKGATTGIIRELKEANIHVVMITGDNVLTAVSVAKECGILMGDERVVHLHADTSGKTPVIYCESVVHGATLGNRRPLDREWRSVDSGHGSWRGSGSASGSGSNNNSFDVEASSTEPKYKIVMTGDAWKVLRERYPNVVSRVVAKGAVFARMTSDQKQQLVVEYQALGYYVGMCGDGANDCGALRSAHTGISLSELESSVAAPFTSTEPDIVCVARVLREGRAALSTSFGVFKFMVAYSLTEFFSVAFLYYFDSNLTDFQFLFIDVALIVNFAFFFGMTEAYTGKLHKNPPLTSLLGLIPLFSIAGQLFLIGIVQFLSYYALTMFPWYVRHTYEGDEANECWENYAVFAVSMFQYIILAIVFSHGSPYRKSIATNKQLMISMLIMTAICIYIAVAPAQWIANFLQLRMPNDSLMCYIVLALASFHFQLLTRACCGRTFESKTGLVYYRALDNNSYRLRCVTYLRVMDSDSLLSDDECIYDPKNVLGVGEQTNISSALLLSESSATNMVEDADNGRPEKRGRELDEEEIWTEVGRRIKVMARNVNGKSIDRVPEDIIEISLSSKQEKLPKQIGLARLLKQENIMDIVKIKYVNAYKVLIQFSNEDSAEKLIHCKYFIDNNYLCKKTFEVGVSYGVIKDIECGLSDEEITRELSSNIPILGVKRLQRRNLSSGNFEDCESVRLCFKGSSLPPYICTYGVRINVEKYVFPVTQCSKCWKFGHHYKTCSLYDNICPKCGKLHPNCETTEFKCINCKGKHMALSKLCPIYKKEKKIRELMAEFNCTYKHALTLYVPPSSPAEATPVMSREADPITNQRSGQSVERPSYSEVLRTSATVHTSASQDDTPVQNSRQTKYQTNNNKNRNKNPLESDNEILVEDEPENTEHEERENSEDKKERTESNNRNSFKQLLNKIKNIIFMKKMTFEEKLKSCWRLVYDRLIIWVSEYLSEWAFFNTFTQWIDTN